MNDQFTVRAVVIFLGVFALAALGGTTWLIHDNVSASSVAVISGAMGVALGALGTLLASVKVGEAPAVPVLMPAPMTSSSGGAVSFGVTRPSGPIGDAAP